MASHTFGALISLNGSSPTTDPIALHQKDPHTSKSPSEAYELDELTFDNRHGGHSRTANTNGTQPPTTPNELELSRPASPPNEERVDIVQTLSHPPMNKYRLLSACLMCFGNGLNGERFCFVTRLEGVTNSYQTALPELCFHTSKSIIISIT